VDRTVRWWSVISNLEAGGRCSFFGPTTMR
jgi:hypothetical protein